jgi:hypothetical protein
MGKWKPGQRKKYRATMRARRQVKSQIVFDPMLDFITREVAALQTRLTTLRRMRALATKL